MDSEQSGVGRRKRRRYDAEYKREVVNETLLPGASVARVAREHGINANQVFKWRRQQLLAKQEALGEGAVLHGAVTLVPVSVISEEASTVARSPTTATTEGLIENTLGQAQIRIRGSVDGATLDRVLASVRR